MSKAFKNKVKLNDWVSVKDFGAVGDGVADDTAAIQLAKAYAIANLPCEINIPKGVFLYTDLGNLAYKGLTIRGQGYGTVLKCTVTGVALTLDAFEPGFTGNDATAPFIHKCNLQNLVVEGNSATTSLIFARGIAQSDWRNVTVREADSVAGIGFNFQGVMLNTFTNLICSTNLDTTMVNIPYNGMRIGAGTRDGVNVGNSTNNSFINCYAEVNQIGWWLTGSEQNTFVNGAPEGCTVYGMIVAPTSKINTFIGVGFENPDASTADVADAGISNEYVNCYSSKKFDLQGDSCRLRGGYYELINVNGAGALKNKIEGVVVNHWATGAGGFTDTGTSTEWVNIYDDDLSAYIYPYKARASITVGASPYEWTNTTDRRVEVVIQTGTLTQVRGKRGGDTWLKSTTVPNTHLVLPGDKLEVSYSVAPGMSYLPHNVAD